MSDKTYNLTIFEQGQGQSLVLLHGLISTHRYWRQVIELLDTDKWHAITPDLLGFGDSPKPKDANYDLAQQISCLDRAIGDKYEPPYALVGHSLGAILALEWALKRPERFKKVILSGLPLVNRGSQYRQMASGAESRQIPNEMVAKLALNAFGWLSLLPPSFMRIHRTWPRHIAEDWAKQSRRAYRKSLHSNTLYSDDLLEFVGQLKVPTRLLIGKHDDMIRDAELDKLRTIARRNKNIAIEVIDGGHNIPLRHPEVVAKAVLQV